MTQGRANETRNFYDLQIKTLRNEETNGTMCAHFINTLHKVLNCQMHSSLMYITLYIAAFKGVGNNCKTVK